MTGATVPVSVIVPTYRRAPLLAETLARIMACEPRAEEILVHVDAGDTETQPMLAARFPEVRVLASKQRMGPGGGRNKLTEAARHGIVVSFDDDSYPLDADFFLRVVRLFESEPDAAVIAVRITDKGQATPPAVAAICDSTGFGGGGVAYRRDAFLATGGYVPLTLAYGMEEIDVSLRLFDQDQRICYSPWLRVFHDNDLSQHATSTVTSASIANTALLVFLRYPVRFWPYGIAQVANRVAWLLKARRFSGLAAGIARIPSHLWHHRCWRRTVRPAALARFLAARRARPDLKPIDVTLGEAR